MKSVQTPILPVAPYFVGNPQKLDYRAICVFAATGFFFDQDTYFEGQKVLRPGTHYTLDSEKGTVLSEEPYFEWHYAPVERSFETVVQEFATLFESLIAEQVADRKVILPLSGGLDSRTLAAALHHLGADVSSYSYELASGHPETLYSAQIAQVCGFPFEKWVIPPGYLWDSIETVGALNGCYTEFTHPRQVAVMERWQSMGDVFCLGHWGDVLFDSMHVPDDLDFEGQVKVLYEKVLKKQGIPFAEALWASWGLEGQFAPYLESRIREGLAQIPIPQSGNARIRAFKSKYWAPRWTSVNLQFFEAHKPMLIPYYDNRMCAFICSVPEAYLADRQIQIAYLKLRNPGLAQITWQDHRPFNLYTYTWNTFPWNFPFRVKQKWVNSVWKPLFGNQKLVRNNYENQFLGLENAAKLEEWLFENPHFSSWVDTALVKRFYDGFTSGAHLAHSHVISTLLTLSVFSKIHKL